MREYDSRSRHGLFSSSPRKLIDVMVEEADAPAKGDRMRRLLVIVVLMVFGLGASRSTPHRDAKACFAIQDGLDRAADLAWVSDPRKASRLRPSYETLRHSSAVLAKALRKGASVESTRELEANLTQAGVEFSTRATKMGVQFPLDLLNQYLEYVRRCSEPY
jgi:hypothetical protein